VRLKVEGFSVQRFSVQRLKVKGERKKEVSGVRCQRCGVRRVGCWKAGRQMRGQRRTEYVMDV